MPVQPMMASTYAFAADDYVAWVDVSVAGVAGFVDDAAGFSFDAGGNDGTYYCRTQWRGSCLLYNVVCKLRNCDAINYGGQLCKSISHGCIRLDRTKVKWIYSNTLRSSKVKVFRTVY